MRAARYHGIRDVRVEEIPIPTPQRGEVQVAISFTGICGSDLHEYFDGPRAVPVAPHPMTGASVPVVLGHESAGIVSAVGPGVPPSLEGELVALDPLRSCGRCRACLDGTPNTCGTVAFHGYSTDGGGFAEFTVVPASTVHRVPLGVSELEAAAAEPLAVAEHAINRSAISAGNSATVIGSGPIGIGVLLGLQRRGVDEVYVVEPSRRRRLTAARLGASTVDPVNGDPGELIHGLRDGRGVDVSFDTVGKPASFEASIRSVRPGGVTVLLASGRLDSVSSGPIVASEIEVRGSLSYTDEFHMVVGLLATGAYRIREWVSVITLDEIVRGFESLRSGDYMKLLVDPRAP